MNSFSRTMRLVSLMAIPAVGLGCVPQDRYDQLLTSYRTLEQQLVTVEGERDAGRKNLEVTQGQLRRTSVDLTELRQQNTRLGDDIERVTRDYDDLMRRVSELEVGPLPIEVESAIHSLAGAYPDVLSFDARRGLLRFASDFTYDLGSATLRQDAAATLRELARILNTDKAAGFEVRIVGHTDDVRIARPETRQHHPTNTHLSVHRSIAVRNELRDAGVSPVRMQVAGYGEHRPIAANRPGGTAENRRVEIFLVPMPAGIDVPISPATATTPAATAVVVPVEPMK
jgi:chemotaxis protein MotB